MKIENNYLHYFKTEADALNVSASLGGISLETVDWVRPYDSTPGERKRKYSVLCNGCAV